MSKVIVKTVQFYKGVELMGSKSSAQTIPRHSEVEATPLGVKCTSFKSKRTILVPWSNVTGCELSYEVPVEEAIQSHKEVTEAPKRGPGRPSKELTQ